MKLFSVIDAPDQQFSTVLSGRRTTIRLRYNPTSDRWSMDLSIDDQPIIQGIRIVLGSNILEPYKRFGLGGIFALGTAAADLPDRGALPSGVVRLYYATQEELDAAVSS